MLSRSAVAASRRASGALPSSRRGLKLAVIPGGRSSVSGITATVVGSTGFLGRYVVNKLGRVGTQCVVAYRGEKDQTRHLKVMGDLGMIIPMEFHARDLDSIARMVEKSDIVINLMGKQELTLNFNLYGSNVEAVANVAKVCKEVGVPRFIHVSALAADLNSPSEWLRRKAESEEEVKKYMPNATILRSGIMYGEEDQFTNLMAKWYKIMGVLPIIGNGKNKIAPIYVDDVAEAVRACVFNQEHDGKTFELAGRKEYTLNEIAEWVREAIWMQHRKIRHVPDLTGALPKEYAYMSPHLTVAKVADFFYRKWPAELPGAPNLLGIRGDVHMMHSASWVPTGKYPTIQELGVTKPVDMKELALEFLRHYRKGGAFAESQDRRGTLT